MLSLEKSIELVMRLERTRNFPRDPEGIGVENLARGLQKASDALQIAGGRIVERCAEISEYCPTDADLLTVARDLARLDSVASGTYDATAGAGNHVSASTRCAKCGGTGWEIRYYLHTREGNGQYAHVRKDRITEEIATQMEPKLDRTKQEIYSGAKRCTCKIPADDYAKRAEGDTK